MTSWCCYRSPNFGASVVRIIRPDFDSSIGAPRKLVAIIHSYRYLGGERKIGLFYPRRVQPEQGWGYPSPQTERSLSNRSMFGMRVSAVTDINRYPKQTPMCTFFRKSCTENVAETGSPRDVCPPCYPLICFMLSVLAHLASFLPYLGLVIQQRMVQRAV